MSYAVDIRRELHQYPEIGFDLPKTLDVVRRELNNMGVSYTEKYGKSSIVAVINDEKSDFTISIRADMDALPITEKTDVPYKSKIDGQMHACGHDAHTAVLLDTVRKMVAIKDKINCRVKFLFQPAEEYPPSGAKLMVEDGVMDDIDCIIGLHTDPDFKAGQVAFIPGPACAISNGFELEFFGKSAHAANQEKGIDAISMAVKAYLAIELAVAKEIPANVPCIFNAGTFHGGTANNCICDYAKMYCTVRTYDESVDEKIISKIKKIIDSVAAESGGEARFVQKKYYPLLCNDFTMTELMRKSAVTVLGEENIGVKVRSMGGEDFAYYAKVKPACFMRLGIRNEEKGCIYSQHEDLFNIDEDALGVGSDIFVQFVLDNMNGIKFDAAANV